MSGPVETTGMQQVEVRYMNADTPGMVEENFELFFPEHVGLSLEEVLQDQESMYLSLQANNARARASVNPNHEESHDQQQVPGGEVESSQVRSAKSQLELDEELAISLQELEHQLGSASLDENSGTETVNAEVNSPETSTQVATQDNVDPDNMTYEELQSLGEVIGAESRGLSDELISYLPSCKYRTGFFMKERHEECVICCMEYKNRERLIKLPCQHSYHSECVTKWLKLNKACPVCQEEVFGT